MELTALLFSAGIFVMGLCNIIALTLPTQVGDVAGTSGPWGSDNNCAMDDDTNKQQCQNPMLLSCVVFAMFAGLCGMAASAMNQKMISFGAAGLAFVAWIIFFAWICIRASIENGYKWQSYETPADIQTGAQGYEFFRDFGNDFFLLAYAVVIAMHAMDKNDMLKLGFCAAFIFWAFFNCIYQWSMNACANDDEQLQCGGSSGGPLDDWKVHMTLAAFTIYWIGGMAGAASVAMKQSMIGFAAAGLLVLASLLDWIAICGTINDIMKGMPDGVSDDLQNTINRAVAAMFFQNIERSVFALFLAVALVMPGGDAPQPSADAPAQGAVAGEVSKV